MAEWTYDFSVANPTSNARGPELAWVEIGVPPGFMNDIGEVSLYDTDQSREMPVAVLPSDYTTHTDGSFHRVTIHFKDFWDADGTNNYQAVFGRRSSVTGGVMNAYSNNDFVVVNDGNVQYQVHIDDSPLAQPQGLYYLYLIGGELRAHGSTLTRVGGNQLEPDQASFQMWWGRHTYLNIERSNLVTRVTLRYERPEIVHWGPGGSTIQQIVRETDFISAKIVLTFYRGIHRIDVHSEKTINERFWNHNGFVMEFSAIRGDSADWTGEFETVYGTSARKVMTTTTDGPTWTRLNTTWMDIDKGADAAPAFHDLDADGDLDMILGSEAQGMSAWENLGDRNDPWFVENANWSSTLPNLTSATPALGDLDGDGDAELLVGEADGYLKLYRNDGGAEGPPNWTRWWGNFDRLGLSHNTAPAFGDPDGDGDLDIVVGLGDGTLKGIVNTGTSSSHSWSMDDTWVQHLSKGLTRAPCDGYSVPSMVDYDYDGDVDLMLGSDDGKVIMFDNVGSPRVPAWTRLDVSHHAGVVTGSAWESNSTPVMVDMDGDGDRDLLIGTHRGTIYHYEFQGNTTPAKGHNNLQPLLNGTYRHMRDKDGNDGPFAVEGYADEFYDYYVLANPRNGYAALRYIPGWDRLAYKQEYYGDEFKFAGGNVSYYPYDPVATEYVTRAQITSNPMSNGVSAGSFISQTGTSAGFIMQPMTAMVYSSNEILLLDVPRQEDPAEYDRFAEPLKVGLKVIEPLDLSVEIYGMVPYGFGNFKVQYIQLWTHNKGDADIEDVTFKIEQTLGEGPGTITETVFLWEEVVSQGTDFWDIGILDWEWNGRVTITISIDVNGTVDESDEYNNNSTYTFHYTPESLPLADDVSITRGSNSSLDADAIVRRDGKLYVVWETCQGIEEIDIQGRSYDPDTRKKGLIETLVSQSHYAVEPDLALKGDVLYLAFSSNIGALKRYHQTAHAKYYWGEKFDLWTMTYDQDAWAQLEQVTRAIDFDDSHQAPELVLQEGRMEIVFRSTHFQFYTNGNQMDNIPFQDMDIRETWELPGGGWSSGNRTVGELTGSQGWWGGPTATPHGTEDVWVVYSSEVGNSQWDLFAEQQRSSLPAPVRERITNTGGADEVRPAIVSGGSPATMLLAYETDTNGNRDIAVRTKTGNGAWTSEHLLTTDRGSDMRPSVAYDGHGNFWVAWESFRMGNKDIFMARYDGTDWHGPYQVTHFPYSDEAPVLACDDQTGRVYVVWETDRNGMGNKDIYMKSYLPRPPVVLLEDPVEIYEDMSVQIMGNATDVDRDIRWVEFDWGDGNSTRRLSFDEHNFPEHVYERAGTYTVSVKAMDGYGLESEVQQVTVEVLNLFPIANLTGDVLVREDAVAEFSAWNSSDTPSDMPFLTVEWLFGDGGTAGPLPLSKGANVSHTYTASGNYTVTVTIIDDDEDYDQAQMDVTVTNRPPTVEAWTRFEELDEDELGEFSGEVTDTPSDETRGHTFIWDWGDGTSSESQLGPLAVHAYSKGGTYTATLKAYDDDGAEGTASVVFVVGNVDPTVSVSGKGSLDEDEDITLTATGVDTSWDVERLEYQWDWGDGTVSDWGAQTEATHSYASDDSYIVTVYVRDDDGAIHSAQHPVTVNNLAPSAMASASPGLVQEGAVVHFTAEGTTDTPSDMEDLSYRWDMGNEFIYEAEFDHVFKAAGIYSITLTVSDDDGDISRATIDVVVTNRAPVAEGWVGPLEVRVGDLVFLDASNSTDDQWDLGGLAFTWSMGDGVTYHQSEGVHAYAYPGTYRITLTVADGDEDENEWVATVNVLPSKEDDGDGDGGGISMIVIGGGIAALVVILLVVGLLVMRARKGPPPGEQDDEGPEHAPEEAHFDREVEAEEASDPEPEEPPTAVPEEVLVEEEVEILRPKDDAAQTDELIERIKADLDLEEE
jgi:PKD repeat protein